MKSVRFLVTPGSVSEEELLAARDERYRQVRKRAARNMRARDAERGTRIRAATVGQDEGPGLDGEGGWSSA
ncbi:MAG TPA: hypothetical protein VF297_08700 [Pyrinomonadaceae bacterium]